MSENKIEINIAPRQPSLMEALEKINLNWAHWRQKILYMMIMPKMPPSAGELRKIGVKMEPRLFVTLFVC